jgi:hypothetical protein
MTVFVGLTLATLTVVVVIEGLALLAVMRQVGTVLTHVAPPRPGVLPGGPTVGQLVPEMLAPSRSSGELVVFLGAHCPACTAVEKILPTVAKAYPQLELVAAVLGEVVSQREAHAKEVPIPARVDLQGLASEWAVPGTPYAVGVGGDGRVVASGIVNTLDQIEALAETVVHSPLWQEPGVEVMGLDDRAELALAGAFAVKEDR